MGWEETLRDRLEFVGVESDAAGIAVSIKVRASGGCFHCNGCNPYTTAKLDQVARESHRHDAEFRYEQHESGPEIIAYVVSGVLLARSIVELVTAIIKWRTEGKKKGDKSDAPIELIVRGFDSNGKMFDEKVLRFNPGETATRELIEKTLNEAVQKRLPPPSDPKPVNEEKKTAKKTKRNKRDK